MNLTGTQNLAEKNLIKWKQCKIMSRLHAFKASMYKRSSKKHVIKYKIQEYL